MFFVPFMGKRLASIPSEEASSEVDEAVACPRFASSRIRRTEEGQRGDQGHALTLGGESPEAFSKRKNEPRQAAGRSTVRVASPRTPRTDNSHSFLKRKDSVVHLHGLANLEEESHQQAFARSLPSVEDLKR